MRLKGTITALITPFINQQLNEEGLIHNIKYQIAKGIDGVLVLGSTGEAATLSSIEQERIISIAVQTTQGGIPVWVGTGSNSTQQTIEKTRRAKELGADIALVVTPYYNKPTQEGIYRHFEAITKNVDLPIIIYNVPGRTGVNIETPTLMRIAQLPNILGVKEASGNINQAGDVIHRAAKECPDFVVFSGDDVLTVPLMALGAVGVISVVSNLMPTEIIASVNAAFLGDFKLARSIHYQLLSLYKGAFIETNPIPIKTAMSLCGMPAGECRLPLCQMTSQNIHALHQVLVEMDLIKEV